MIFHFKIFYYKQFRSRIKHSNSSIGLQNRRHQIRSAFNNNEKPIKFGNFIYLGKSIYVVEGKTVKISNENFYLFPEHNNFGIYNYTNVVFNVSSILINVLIQNY